MSLTPQRGRLPRKIGGLRASALFEIIVLLALAVLVDKFLLTGDRFATVSPHPFWIVILLTAAQYGTSEALVAAALSTTALLLSNLPEQAFGEDLYAWLLRISFNPILWCIAAVTLGEIRTSHRRKTESMREELTEVHEHASAVVDAYEHLSQIKTALEVRVAGQSRTVRTMYSAACAIERQSMREVLIGITQLVRSVMNPEKFSFFMIHEKVLELETSEGWGASDLLRREFRADSSALFAAVVGERRFLVASDPEHEAILAGEGLLAGPLFSEETGELIGMLKIESLPFHELTPAAVQNFRILCDWIGTASAKAQRYDRMRSIRRPISATELE
ncbi:MAG: polysaccharide biosynthesis protein PelD [Acetobacteraceae bacterium]|nr:polysaccharide biosynthesis protein PelD [Acetobacteraceae bacterium]